MSFDIYGQNLRRGYCEVHPDVPEEYPCFYCRQDYENHRKQKEEYELAIAEQENFGHRRTLQHLQELLQAEYFKLIALVRSLKS